MAIVERAYAKVNLWLEVLGRRDDGYHELETVMHEIDLHDVVTLEPTDSGVELEVSDPSVGTGEDNLAVKAVRALEAHTGRDLPCRITLEKNIPAGGGLGGGSSDAAAVLRALDAAHDLRLDAPTLEAVAATFGSDTSFFVRGGTSLCRGRGEIIEPLPAPETLWFVLVLPGQVIPTARIFKGLRLTGPSRQVYHHLQSLEVGDVPQLRGLLHNRLQDVARAEFGLVDELLEELAPWSPLLSGSGSTLFILCDDRGHAEQVCADIGFVERRGVGTRIASSARRGPETA